MIGRPSFGAPKVRSPSPPLSRIFPCVSYCSGDAFSPEFFRFISPYFPQSLPRIFSQLAKFLHVYLSPPTSQSPPPQSRLRHCIPRAVAYVSLQGHHYPLFCVSLSCPSLPPPLPLWSSLQTSIALRWLPIRSPSGGGFAPQVCTWLTGCADLLLFLAFPPTQFLLLPKIPFSLVLSTPLPLCDPSSPLPLFSWLASA